MNIKNRIHIKFTSRMIFIGLMFLLFGIPFLINEFYKFGSYLPFYSTQWKAEHMLGYYGTVFGGAATFGAVYLTIGHERKIRKFELRHERNIRKKEYEERLAYEFRPFFIIESIWLGWHGLDKDAFQDYSRNLFDTEVNEYNMLSFRHVDDKWKIIIPKGFIPEDESINLSILIKNIGSGAAINIMSVDDDIAYVKHIDQAIEASCSDYIDFYFGNCPEGQTVKYNVEYYNINGFKYTQEIEFFVGETSTSFNLYVEHIGKQKFEGFNNSLKSNTVDRHKLHPGS